MRWGFSFVGALMLCGVGCSSPTYIEDLSTPALVWTQSSGLCSKILAVDGDRVVWSNQGCEDGRPKLSEVRTATQAQADDVWAKFAALPFGQGATLEMCAGRLLHSFGNLDAQSPREAAACGGTQYDDVSSLPDAFLPLAEALRGLE
jgi:hypothetical protein